MKLFTNTWAQDQKSDLLKLTRSRLILLILISMTIGGLVGLVMAGDVRNQTAAAVTQNNAIRENGYKFTHPLLIDTDHNQAEEFASLKNEIYKGTYEILNDPQVKTVSVYFRDLTSARWMGIRENEIYDSGSLLKVSLLIAYLKQSESDPFLFSKKILYRGEPNDNKNIEFYNLKPGNEYTVGELLNVMIVKSDNSAKDLLLALLDKNFLDKVFGELGLLIPYENEQYQISPKIYSLFFRLLYNATYLTRDDSEKALELLNDSEYRDGLVAGVLSTITIAHKFGQYKVPTTNGVGTDGWELHDCGIVYHPDRPYLLCIMTKGENAGKLSELIKTISQITYKAVNNNFQ